MPTYRNDGNNSVVVKDTFDKSQSLKSGESIETYTFYNIDDLVKTSDDPLYNPVVSNTDVVSTGVGDDKTETLSSTTEYVKIWQVTDANVSVFFQNADNTPAASVLRPGDSANICLNDYAEQIVMQFSAAGSCNVIQSKESIE